MKMELSTLSLLLGAGVCLPSAYGLWKPAQYAAAARKFPRSLLWGYLLMALATFWFSWNVRHEPIADFESLKPALIALFVAVGLGACIFVQDFLAVRGLAAILLLLAKLMVDTARWHESDWRLVIVTWAYVLVVAGIWLTVSPWRLRDLIEWSAASPQRLRLCSALRLAFGLLVLALGLAVF